MQLNNFLKFNKKETLVLILLFLFSLPFFIYHIWMFVAPGLLKKEKKIDQFSSNAKGDAKNAGEELVEKNG